jgi:hypothetical protein
LYCANTLKFPFSSCYHSLSSTYLIHICKISANIRSIGNTFSRIPDCVGSTLVLPAQDILYTILDGLKAPNREKFFGSFNQKVEALMPKNIFHSNAAISQNQASTILDPMKLTLYLLSNNFLGATSDVSEKIYDWVKHYSDTGLIEYLLSIRGPTVEALAENLFRLALDA